MVAGSKSERKDRSESERNTPAQKLSEPQGSENERSAPVQNVSESRGSGFEWSLAQNLSETPVLDLSGSKSEWKRSKSE